MPCNPLPVTSATSPRLILTGANPELPMASKPPASGLHAPDTMQLPLTPALISNLRKHTLFFIMHTAAFFSACCAYVQVGASIRAT